MQWVKAHLNLVITIAVGVLGIVGIVLGILLSSVKADMQADQGTLSSVTSTKGANLAAIEAAREHAQKTKADLDRALKDFEAIGNHKPILESVFPAVPANDAAAPFRFKPAYRKALDDMLVALNATDEPNESDYRRELDEINDAKARAEREKNLGTAATRPFGAPATAPAVGRTGFGGTGTGFGQAPRPALTPEEAVREDPQIRASIRKARAGRCYANLSTFMQPALLTSDQAPSVDEMWYSQAILWVEQDMVAALAAVNNAVAEKLPEADRWVGNLPVKRIASIQVSNYVPPSAGAASPGGPAAPAMPAATGNNAPPGMAGAVFTNRGSGSGVDVLQVSLDLYLNAQYLPVVVNEITRSGFYTALLVNYEAYSPTTSWVGPIYGKDPVIHAQLLFEGSFLESRLEKWMPESVKKAIAEGRAGLNAVQSAAPRPGGMTGPMGMPPMGGPMGGPPMGGPGGP